MTRKIETRSSVVKRFFIDDFLDMPLQCPVVWRQRNFMTIRPWFLRRDCYLCLISEFFRCASDASFVQRFEDRAVRLPDGAATIIATRDRDGRMDIARMARLSHFCARTAH